MLLALRVTEACPPIDPPSERKRRSLFQDGKFAPALGLDIAGKDRVHAGVAGDGASRHGGFAVKLCPVKDIAEDTVLGGEIARTDNVDERSAADRAGSVVSNFDVEKVARSHIGESKVEQSIAGDRPAPNKRAAKNIKAGVLNLGKETACGGDVAGDIKLRVALGMVPPALC